jgi:uncharacterized protein (DUF608 family)
MRPVRKALVPSATGRTRDFDADALLQIAMPMGGLGAGCICLNGHGGLQDFSIANRPDTTALPDGHGSTHAAFALLRATPSGGEPLALLVEGPMPAGKVYNLGLHGQGYRKGGHEGLPRFRECRFRAEYPFGHVELRDRDMPLVVELTGWSPLIPLDDVNSGLPCAVLEYTLTNRTRLEVSYAFSYHMSHWAPGGERERSSRNRRIPGGALLYNRDGDEAETRGSTALVVIGHEPRVKAMWFRGGWFDSIAMLWNEVSAGTFGENEGNTAADVPGRNGASVQVEGTLEPGGAVTVPVVLTWHFPNVTYRHGGLKTAAPAAAACGPAWRPFYAGRFEDAAGVATWVRERYADLRGRTRAFRDALASSTVPDEVLDAVASNLAILKSPTVLRQESGNLWGWEGCFCSAGCCAGSCTHVWNYAQALPHLFPALERTLREQEFERSMDERGHVQFRATLPDGPANHDFHAAADGQLGGILKLYRDARIFGDRDWLARLYPLAKRSLSYAIETWDPDRRGGLFEPHHNTYDIEFWGPDGMCGTVYLGALCAMAEMAREMGDAEWARSCEELAGRAADLLDRELFNGEYYAHRVQWEGLRASAAFRQRLDADDPAMRDTLSIERREGPRYQYGQGCLADGVIGAWMASLYGVETPLNREHVRSTLRAIVRHNFRSDLSRHACTQRPGYAIGVEGGLVLCTWPNGGRPSLPFPYSDEVWTGFEYQVASHLIAEGMPRQGLDLVAAARARYDGRTRNPFNEYECGNYYARAMSSFALLLALSGFRYAADTKTLWLAPRLPVRPFRVFFSAASGYGTIELGQDALEVRMLHGELEVETLRLGTESGETVRRPGGVARAGASLRIPINRTTRSP